MAATRVFDKQLLSATAPGLGFPSPTNLTYTLSSTNHLGTFDVVVDTLSAGDNGDVVGLVFNKLTLTNTVSTLSTATFAGHSFRIAVGYHLQEFGLLFGDRTVTTFRYLSSGIAQTLLSANNTNEVTYPGRQRLVLMGYV
jgi:hypothetical protein